MKQLYIIAGCNGAGKTTASFTVLPEILDCNNFVNADEIAKGLSPFQPAKADIQAGRLMLKRIHSLLEARQNFAFETTLATRSFTGFVKKAQNSGYHVTLLFFWLDSVALAISRVLTRVEEGGHDIPADTIIRRYYNGLDNFFNLYLPLVNEWMLINNSGNKYNVVAQGRNSLQNIIEEAIWINLNEKYV